MLVKKKKVILFEDSVHCTVRVASWATREKERGETVHCSNTVQCTLVQHDYSTTYSINVFVVGLMILFCTFHRVASSVYRHSSGTYCIYCITVTTNELHRTRCSVCMICPR